MLSIQDLDHPFLAEAIQGTPFELQSVVAGSILVIPRDFVQGPGRLSVNLLHVSDGLFF